MGHKHKTWQEVLASRIREGILKAGYTSQEQFARSIALPRMTLYKLLKGEVDPRFSTVVKIADGLDFTLSELLANHTPGASQTNSGRSLSSKPGRRPKKTVTISLTVSSDEIPDWLNAALLAAQPAGSKSS